MSDYSYPKLIEAMPGEASVREQLLSELAEVGEGLEVRGMFATMMRDAATARDPLALADREALLDDAISSPFGMLPLADFTALAVLLGSLVYEGLGPEEAGNRAMSDAIRENHDAPVVRTLVASSDSSWDHFLNDFRHWETIVWTLESEFERVDNHSLVMTIPASIARYTNPGFWRGMMPLFGVLGEVSADVVEGSCKVMVRCE